MDVEYDLARGLAIREKEIDSLASETAPPQRCRHDHAVLEELRAELGWQLSQIRGVLLRNDEYVPRIDWMDVHEGKGGGVLVDHTCGGLPPDDLAEDASRRFLESHAMNRTPEKG